MDCVATNLLWQNGCERYWVERGVLEMGVDRAKVSTSVNLAGGGAIFDF